MRNSTSWFFCFLLLSSCAPEKDQDVLSAFDVYCEMVANDAKPMALHYPMEGEAVDGLWNEFVAASKKYKVKLYREDDFPNSMLFPSEQTNGKSVILIYQGDRLKQYEQWKNDISKTSNKEEQEALARRFGRLLGYSPQGINELLSANTSYRSLTSFEVRQQVTHLYYSDLEVARLFYKKTLGLPMSDISKFQISADAFIQLHAQDESHPEGQPKSTAIALLTDQLPEWYAYAQDHNIQIKYTYKPKEGGPHDGFVAIDPGGYLLEFEQFKQHPENELFIAALDQVERVNTAQDNLQFYGSITWTYHKDMLKMERFYEDVLGYQKVADQGWTKIYQTSSAGFIGLVDERRGMENYADTKAMELEWKVSDQKSFDAYANQYWKEYLYTQGSMTGPEKYNYHVKIMQLP
jgi:catechol 2,3-dioxygenase-like lactoylglutathione lyase family enzyme